MWVGSTLTLVVFLQAATTKTLRFGRTAGPRLLKQPIDPVRHGSGIRLKVGHAVSFDRRAGLGTEIRVYQGLNMDRSFRIHRVFTQADVHAVQNNPKAQVLATMMKPHHVLLSEIVDKVPMLAADGTDIQLQEVFLRHS